MSGLRRRPQGAGRGAALAMLLATAACSTAPDYVRPSTAAPAAYKEAAGWQAAGTNLASPGRWWEVFADPVLTGLEERVVAGNQDLAVAAARYEQARALARQARADRFPQVGVSADVSRDRVSDGRPLAPGGAAPYTVGTVGASLAYELDLFGRVRNSVRASTADAAASAADVAAVTLGLQAQLAGIYFDMRGLDARIVLLRQTVAANERAYQLTETRHGGGIASGIDVSRAQTLLSSARAELSAVGVARQRDEHAIAVLLGELPSTFALAVDDRQLAPPPIPAGLPSTLLERRPDIAAAERRVAAANAQIGVARAAFFPALTLSTAAGYRSSTLDDIVRAPNLFWSIGPALALSVFDNGARRAAVDSAGFAVEQAAAAYRQVVITSLQEVEDNLAAAAVLQDELAVQQQALVAARKALEVANNQYRAGIVSYLNVVTAQATVLSAQRSLVDVRNRRLVAVNVLLKNIGGSF